MIAWLKRNPLFVLLLSCGICLLGVGMVAGTLVALTMTPQPQAGLPLSELPLHATATDTGDSMAIATGPVDEEMEGIFFLDFLTGELALAVIASRKADMISGLFKTNVIKDLGVEQSKKPSYLMVTGAAQFVGQTGRKRPGRCVVYVVDQNTGNFAGYGFNWDRTAASGPVLQTDQLIRLVSGNARAAKLQE